MTHDLVTFLMARLDEDERDARANRGVFPSPAVEDNGAVWMHIRPGGNAVITRYLHPTEGYDDMAKLRSWADTETGWTQRRILAEIDAKRQIVKLHGRLDVASFCVTCDAPSGIPGEPHGCPTLRLLAQPFAAHPEYQEEWRP